MYIHYTRTPEYAKAVRQLGYYRAAQTVPNPVRWSWRAEGDNDPVTEVDGADKDALEDFYDLLKFGYIYAYCWNATEVSALIYGATGALIHPLTLTDLSVLYKVLGSDVADEPTDVEDLRSRHLALPDSYRDDLYCWNMVAREAEMINIRGVRIDTDLAPEQSILSRQVCDDGRLRGGYTILAARKTGRTISSALYGLKRGGLERRAITGTNGHPLLCADWSSLEPRVMAYLLDIEWKNDAAASGLDIYTETYRRIMGTPNAYVTEEQRKRAKLLDIACGYGAGPDAIAKSLGTKNEDHKQRIEGAKNATFLHHRWHAIHPEVDEMTKRLTKLLRDPDAAPVQIRNITVGYRGEELIVELPSRRVLRYSNFSRRYSSVSAVSPDETKRTRLTGAVLLQNIVCAFAADILYHTLRRCAFLQCVVMHQYDEIVLDLGLTGKPKEWAERWLTYYMTTPPEWAKGLALSIKTKEVMRYE